MLTACASPARLPILCSLAGDAHAVQDGHPGTSHTSPTSPGARAHIPFPCRPLDEFEVKPVRHNASPNYTKCCNAAGLAAVGTAKQMGAIVRVFDTRPSVEEQVRESWPAPMLQVSAFKQQLHVGQGRAKRSSER